MVGKEAIKNAPSCPGVYLMKDVCGQVIYVGKARSLKKRLASYFSGRHGGSKTALLMSSVCSIDHLRTQTETEALILESDLIKAHRPRFNIVMKDDKSFPYLKLTHELYPRVMIGRRRKNQSEDVDYFGPYTNPRLLREALKMLRKSFPFRSCRRIPRRACLNYHIGLCVAPCVKKIPAGVYRRMIRRLARFLLAPDERLIAELSRRMERFVARQRFEEAASVRDQLQVLGVLASLKKTEALLTDDVDRLGLSQEPGRVEGFDISNIHARQAVGSMVTFVAGEPDKRHYRRFKIRTVTGVDDYAMICEVVRRRYTRLLEESGLLPDLILIDGGRGHLEAVARVLKDLGVRVPVVSLAKREELVFTLQRQDPVKFARDSKMLQLLQRVRDEAHRFALGYHRYLRTKALYASSPKIQ